MEGFLILEGLTVVFKTRLKKEQGKDFIKKVPVKTCGVSKNDLQTYNLYAYTSDVRMIVGDESRKIFALANIHVPTSYPDAPVVAVSMMRKYGTKRFDYMIRMMKRDRPPKCTVEEQNLIVSLCEQYRAWRESDELKKVIRGVNQMWDFVRHRNSYLRYNKNSVPRPMRYWNGQSVFRMAKQISVAAHESKYNEWYLLYMLKCWALRTARTIGEGDGFLPIIFKSEADDLSKGMEAIVDAFVEFVRTRLLTGKYMFSLSSTNQVYKKRKGETDRNRKASIHPAAKKYTYNEFFTYWDKWAGSHFPDYLHLAKYETKSTHATVRKCMCYALFNHIAHYGTRGGVGVLREFENEKIGLVIYMTHTKHIKK